jgi:small subunit ribosomal protein S20
MANLKSAIKANRQNQKRVVKNRVYRGGARTAVKKARLAIEGADANAPESIRQAMQALDRAASKGLIHKNNAARRKSRLVLALNKSKATA